MDMRNRFLWLLLAVFVALPLSGETWYVRPDGGTRYSAAAHGGQCDGKADAAREAADAARQGAQAESEHQAQVQSETKLRDEAQILTAGQVTYAYSSNEVSADSALKGKVFKVSGKVVRVGKDITNTAYVILTDNGDEDIRSVQCFFDDSRLSEISSLSPGQEVIIFGTCEGLMMNVLMKDCELVQGQSPDQSKTPSH